MLHCLIQESVSPLRGFSAGSAARLSSSSLAPSLCWWFVWPDTSADGGEAGWDTSPLPQHAYKHTHLSTRDCIFHIYCIEREEARWEDGGGMMFWAEMKPSTTAWTTASKSWWGFMVRLTVASASWNNLTQQAARGGQPNTSTESFQSWCKSSCFQK